MSAHYLIADLGRGAVMYRATTLTNRIGMSVFEFFCERRLQWRTLRNGDKRRSLWHMMKGYEL